MKRAAIAALLGGVLVSAGAAMPAAGAPLVPIAPTALAATDGSVHLASHTARPHKRKRIRKYRAKRHHYRTPRRYHSWDDRWLWKKSLHSRKFVGERYHRHCGDWHRCHYYFYGFLQWQKWNPGGSRKYFLRRYHH